VSEQDLFQKRLEAKNKVFNKIDEFMDRWEKRIRLSNLRLAERFLDVEFDVLLHVRLLRRNVGCQFSRSTRRGTSQP
jgi:hypothetical protein